MASQAAGFAKVIAGGVLLTAGIGGHSIRDVIAGKGGSIEPLSPGSASNRFPAGGEPGEAAPSAPGASAKPLPGWHRSRVDAGVDFYGGRQIAAPEGGTIVKTGPYGGAGGGFGPGGILLHTEAGHFIYFYEGLEELVHAGQRVAAGQLIARGIPGGSIEVGFANGEGNPLAQAVGESTGNNVTKWGTRFLHWLGLLGSPRAAHP